MVNSNSFIWHTKDEQKYFNILYKNYITKLFEHIKDKNYMFYIEYDDNIDFNNYCKYYGQNQSINISEFEKTKNFKHYTEFPLDFEYKGKLYHDPAIEVGFTITDFEPESQWFKGLCYNSGIDGDEPIEYSGNIKAYGYFKCTCSHRPNGTYDKDGILICRNEDNCEDRPDEMLCSCKDDVPWIEIHCNTIDSNISFLRHCIGFNIKYTKF